MTRGVYEIQRIFLTVHGVEHLYGVALDGYAALTLQVHIVEHLALCDLNRVRTFQKAVGQGALPVVNMRNYAKIPYLFHFLFLLSVFHSRKRVPIRASTTFTT